MFFFFIFIHRSLSCGDRGNEVSDSVGGVRKDQSRNAYPRRRPLDPGREPLLLLGLQSRIRMARSTFRGREEHGTCGPVYDSSIRIISLQYVIIPRLNSPLQISNEKPPFPPPSSQASHYQPPSSSSAPSSAPSSSPAASAGPSRITRSNS